MVKNDDFLETFLDSLKYAFSNMSALLVGGIVFFLSLIVIGLPFFLGYITRCMRQIMAGDGVLPEWENVTGMFRDGIRMVIVFLAYAAMFAVVIALPAIPVLVFSYLNMRYMVLLSTAALILTMAVMLSVFAIVFFASWVLYASYGSVRIALSPRRIKQLISLNPVGYMIALLASVAVMAVGSISALLLVIIPWVAFAACAAITFIYAKYYQNTMKSASVWYAHE
jgi:hypothetical protein